MRKKVKKLNSRLTDSDNKDQSRGTVSLMAFSIFSIPRSVSASCFFSAGIVASSLFCKARMLSAMRLISSSHKTLLTVRMTAARSMKSFLTDFFLQPSFRFAPAHL